MLGVLFSVLFFFFLKQDWVLAGGESGDLEL